MARPPRRARRSRRNPVNQVGDKWVIVDTSGRDTGKYAFSREKAETIAARLGFSGQAAIPVQVVTPEEGRWVEGDEGPDDYESPEEEAISYARRLRKQAARRSQYYQMGFDEAADGSEEDEPDPDWTSKAKADYAEGYRSGRVAWEAGSSFR